MTTAGLLVASLTGAIAQDSHEQHHPETAPVAETPSPQVPPAPSEESGSAVKGGDMGGMGSMMGSDHMSMMMKMMQDMHGKMMGGEMAMQPNGDKGSSSQAFNGIMARMHQDMAITYTGKADVDFVKGMIPHHQAAVDMAKTELAFGKDPEIRKLAEDVVKAQEAEIASMEDWLKKQNQ
jgi:hypothetical protein